MQTLAQFVWLINSITNFRWIALFFSWKKEDKAGAASDSLNLVNWAVSLNLHQELDKTMAWLFPFIKPISDT